MKENDTLRPPLKAIYLVPQSMITITEEGLRLRVGETLSAYKARAELTAKLIGSLTFFHPASGQRSSCFAWSFPF